ncbi:helix-turn-helix domain-containing protein [Hydrogenovibrio sp. JE_KL2]|uniref:helix-turn-helix domain-containing protein n=1 Tax=Hydrogenovibrio sp. JE_KL2 TaxID=2651188 RepID=UPI001C12B4C5|nr:helix-turn-helix domain-containing protein [Hydrogenovibrio sp. JE_KL2]
MNDFAHISAFIKQYRLANQETLQSLSERSQVSRSMIAQIESGQACPTINVLSKLANAMNIRLGELVEPPENQSRIKVFQPNENNIVSKPNHPFVCHHLTHQAGKVPTDFYSFHFTDYGKTDFGANIPGSTKYLWLESGQLTIYHATENITLKAGRMATFNAAIPHRFESKSGSLAKGIFLVTYDNA